MSFFRARWSALIAWGMIPLAVWAGLPSTACLCANGGIKLVCTHPGCGGKSHAGHDSQSTCRSHCCATNGCAANAMIDEVESDEHADCCGDADRGLNESRTGVHAKACCKPVLAAPGMPPKASSVAYDSAPATVVSAAEIGIPPQTSLHRDRDIVEANTGPPLDRVIVFRSLLI